MVAPSPSITIILERRDKHIFERLVERLVVRMADRWSIAGFPAIPLASTSTMSLVLVSPSTEIRLNERSDGQSRGLLEDARSDPRVGRHKCQHGGHIGGDHARPLRHAADADADTTKCALAPRPLS